MTEAKDSVTLTGLKQNVLGGRNKDHKGVAAQDNGVCNDPSHSN